MYEYKCKAGHLTTRVVIKPTADEPKESTRCKGAMDCDMKATLVPSRTGTPILKRGCGGFFKPNA